MVDILNKLDKSETVKAFTDEQRTPISNLTAAKAIKVLLDYILINKNPSSRIWHLGGSQSLSRFELALLIADVFEKNKDLVIPLIRDEIPMSAARPENVSLDSRLFSNTLNFEIPSLKKQLIELKSNQQ
jgi:dTDP-4-dehydrorhamnose reductase